MSRTYPYEDDLEITDYSYVTRWRVGTKLIEWGITNNYIDGLVVLKNLFGSDWRKGPSVNPIRLTPDGVRKLKLLDGPNGYTIYKILVARKNDQG